MRLTRVAGLTVAFLGTTVLGVSVASALVEEGDPVQPQSLVAVPGSAFVDQSAADPDGDPGWAVRLYDTASGGDCAELGRVTAGRFGRVDSDGQFQELAADEGGTCGNLAIDPAILGIADYPAGPGRAARTVLFGRVGGDVAKIGVTPAGAAEVQLKTGPGGAFVFPRAGPVVPTALPVRITLASGKQLTFDWR